MANTMPPLPSSSGITDIYSSEAIPIAKPRLIIPVEYPRPVYAVPEQLKEIKHYTRGARTKKERNAERKKVQEHMSAANLPPDLVGVKFGILTVEKWIGAGKWEVVCVCGNREQRRTRAVRNPANTFDACVECRKPIEKLKIDYYKGTGKKVSCEVCFEYLYGQQEASKPIVNTEEA